MKSITSVQTNCKKRLSDGDHMTSWRCSWIWSILHGIKFPCWININLQVSYVHLCLKVSLSTSLSKFEGSFVNCLPAWCCVCLSIWPLRFVTETTLHSTPSMRHLHPYRKLDVTTWKSLQELQTLSRPMYKRVNVNLRKYLTGWFFWLVRPKND